MKNEEIKYLVIGLVIGIVTANVVLLIVDSLIFSYMTLAFHYCG